MVQKDQIIEETMEHAGIFDFAAFYSFAHSWFKEERYGVTEEKYSEKVSGDARNINIKWLSSKDFDDYFKIEIEILFSIKDLTDVQVEIDGEKRKMNKGTIALKIRGTLTKDYESKWDPSPVTRFLRDVYNKYVIPQKVNDMKSMVQQEVTVFKDELKAFLELEGKR